MSFIMSITRKRVGFMIRILPIVRHAELVSASIAPHRSQAGSSGGVGRPDLISAWREMDPETSSGDE
jgi:hypothetical protein